jgi:hypothetical protein
MGPPLCSRWKGTGYVDLRHVLLGDHTVGKSAPFLFFFLALFLPFSRYCYPVRYPLCRRLRLPFEWTRRSGTVLTSLVCRPVETRQGSLDQQLADPVGSACYFAFITGIFAFHRFSLVLPPDLRSSSVVLLLPGSHWITGSAYHIV